MPNLIQVIAMSRYTITLGEIVELYSQNKGQNIREKIEIARPLLFDFTYPLFDANYKKDFETHFIRNFWNREIGFETEGLFKFHLENWMQVNMPYYNKLFNSELITFDPLSNAKSTTTKNGTHTANGSNTNNTTQNNNGTLTENNFDRQLNSNTPDTRLTITSNNGQGVIEYASEINENSENNSRTSTNAITGSDNGSSTLNSTDNETYSKSGKIGVTSFSKMLVEYRNSFIRIEQKLFDEVSSKLFMLIY